MNWRLGAFLSLGSFVMIGVATGGSCLVAHAQAAPAGSFQVEPVKVLRKGVDAWPLIVNPSNPAEQRVNATLTKLNQRLAQALHDCDAGYEESLKGMGSGAKGQDPVSKDWSRSVKVTMAGPRFLSMVASDEAFCGGAYPDSDQMAMVFDMTTGAPVNWLALVAKSTGATAYLDSVMDGSKVGALVLPALKPMLLAAADADCKDAFQDPQSYQVWPDAKQGKLVAQPFDLPHVVQACGNEIDLTVDQARKLGFSETLLTAIDQAHKQGAAR